VILNKCRLEEGFFEGLPEMPGAIEAAKEMEKAGFNVFICTSPILKSRYCTQEKLNWIRNYLGESWLHKVIISPDKVHYLQVLYC
jgi:5'-nucleotidase